MGVSLGQYKKQIFHLIDVGFVNKINKWINQSRNIMWKSIKNVYLIFTNVSPMNDVQRGESNDVIHRKYFSPIPI